MGTLRSMAEAWQAHRAELARWTMQRLVNRTDTWAGFLPPKKGSSDRITTIVMGELDESRLARHYTGRNIKDLIGLHSTSADRTCRWFAINVHASKADDPSTPGDIFHAALGWNDKLRCLGCDPILEEPAGPGSYVLRVLLDLAADVVPVCDFVVELVSDYGNYELYQPAATFPDGRCVEGDGSDNWLALPGPRPTGEGFGRIWNGKEWLEGHAAIKGILSVRPTPGHVIYHRKKVTVGKPMNLTHRDAEIRLDQSQSDSSHEALPRDLEPGIAKEPPVLPLDTTQRTNHDLAEFQWPSSAAQFVNVTADRTGMRHEEIIKRLFEWIGEQDDVVQAIILGQIPEAICPDVWRLIFESKAKQQPAS